MPGLSVAEEFQVLAHEFAHWRLSLFNAETTQ